MEAIRNSELAVRSGLGLSFSDRLAACGADVHAITIGGGYARF
jgi:hypothetical protein